MKLTRHLFSFYLILMAALLVTACGSSTLQLKHLSTQDVIVAFGDSLTYGTGATQATSYPASLEKLIGINVINEGIPGEETADGLERITGVLEKYHPSIVILCLGGNDQLRKRNPEQIKENLKMIIALIRKTGAGVLLIAVPVPSLGLSVPGFYVELGNEFNIPVDETALADLLKQPDMKSDPIHLNAAGYHALAKSIAGTLKKAGAL